jgi:phosphoribosylanthranilate isomerase
MTLVKICGITNLEDALAATQAGASALGFNFYRLSPRYIAPEKARLIVARLPPEILTVGVFVNESSPALVARIADVAGVTSVQLHGDETPEYCCALKERFVIKALRVGENFVPESALEFETQAILLDAFDAGLRGGTGRVIDWRLARQTRELVPRLFLAGGLGIENVAEAIREVHPYAVDACSSLESAPGRKSALSVRAFIAATHV